ncbi:MAG: hypothetical protein ICV75_08865 [Nitrospiraceae bacterium]|nr:hypothetical protein [Nitrospiraceae bacterium]
MSTYIHPAKVTGSKYSGQGTSATISGGTVTVMGLSPEGVVVGQPYTISNIDGTVSYKTTCTSANPAMATFKVD